MIDTEIGFEGIDLALKRMEDREVFGKIILRVGQDGASDGAGSGPGDGKAGATPA